MEPICNWHAVEKGNVECWNVAMFQVRRMKGSEQTYELCRQHSEQFIRRTKR